MLHWKTTSVRMHPPIGLNVCHLNCHTNWDLVRETTFRSQRKSVFRHVVSLNVTQPWYTRITQMVGTWYVIHIHLSLSISFSLSLYFTNKKFYQLTHIHHSWIWWKRYVERVWGVRQRKLYDCAGERSRQHTMHWRYREGYCWELGIHQGSTGVMQ